MLPGVFLSLTPVHVWTDGQCCPDLLDFSEARNLLILGTSGSQADEAGVQASVDSARSQGTESKCCSFPCFLG